TLRTAAQPLPPGRAARRAGAGRLDARRLPAPAARDARAARRLRRRLSPLRRGHRALLPRRKGGLGALVRAGGSGHAPLRGRDRPASADPPHALALAWNRSIRAQASRAAVRSLAKRVPPPRRDAGTRARALLRRDEPGERYVSARPGH